MMYTPACRRGGGGGYSSGPTYPVELGVRDAGERGVGNTSFAFFPRARRDPGQLVRALPGALHTAKNDVRKPCILEYIVRSQAYGAPPCNSNHAWKGRSDSENVTRNMNSPVRAALVRVAANSEEGSRTPASQTHFDVKDMQSMQRGASNTNNMYTSLVCAESHCHRTPH